MLRHARQGVLVLVLVLILGHAPSAAAQPIVPRDYAGLPLDLAALHFPVTGHNLAGGFLRYWWEHGQVVMFGLPISEEMTEGGRTVQYFERARFEYHPENRPPWDILGGHLGRQAMDAGY